MARLGRCQDPSRRTSPAATVVRADDRWGLFTRRDLHIYDAEHELLEVSADPGAPPLRMSRPRVSVVLATERSELAAHADSWRELESAALDASAYLSPDFVIPALRQDPNGKHRVLLVRRHHRGGRRLIGCAVFTLQQRSPGLPFKTMSTWAYPHAHLCTPLLHRNHAQEAARALWDWLDAHPESWLLGRWRGIPLRSSTWMILLEILAERGRDTWVRHGYERPILKRHACFNNWLHSLSKRRRKGLQRKWRILGVQGNVQVRLHRDLSDRGVARRFMELEALGWKGEQATAMRCDPGKARFFEEVTARFGRRQALFFVELQVDGRAVAMTANFVSGDILFAFKVAWDPAYRRRSPGILAEVQTVRLFHECHELKLGESGTGAGSYLSSYWCDSTPIGEVLVARAGTVSHGALKLLPRAREVKRAATSLQAWLPTDLWSDWSPATPEASLLRPSLTGQRGAVGAGTGDS